MSEIDVLLYIGYIPYYLKDDPIWKSSCIQPIIIDNQARPCSYYFLINCMMV